MTRPLDAADAAVIARSYLASFASGDPDKIADHVSVDFVNEHTAALGTGCVGKAAYRERLPSFLADMADLRYEVESLVVGDQSRKSVEVAAFYTMSARWQGTSPISVRGAQRLTLTDGYITRRVDYWDSASFLMQIDGAAQQALTSFGCT